MAIQTIGTASRNYSTLQSWEDAMPATLTTPMVGEVYADSEFVATAPLVISGIVTDSTNTLTLRAAAGQSFKDHASKTTNRLAYDATKGVAIRASAGYSYGIQVSGVANVTLQGLQVKAGVAPAQGIWSNGAGTVVRDCIVMARPFATTDNAVVHLETSGKVINSLLICDTANACSGVMFISGGTAVNCTVVRPTNYTATGRAIKDNYAPNATVKNCAFFGFLDFSGTFNADGHNVTDMATAPGTTSNLVSKTYASQFVQTSTASSLEDFSPKSTADGNTAGVRDATNTADLDILGIARSTTTPSIGAREYVAAGGGGTTTTLIPNAAALALTGFAPTVSQTVTLSLSPAPAALALTGFAPTVARTANLGTSPTPATLTFTGYAPSVSQSASQNLIPAPAALTLTGYAPSVTQALSSPTLTPNPAVLILTGFAPTVTQAPAAVAGGGGSGGSVRDVRAFADQLARASKQTKSHKKQVRRALETEALALLPDEPAAKQIAPVLAALVAREQAPLLAAWQPVRALMPVALPHAAEAQLMALVQQWQMAREAAEWAANDEFETELLLLGAA